MVAWEGELGAGACRAIVGLEGVRPSVSESDQVRTDPVAMTATAKEPAMASRGMLGGVRNRQRRSQAI